MSSPIPLDVGATHSFTAPTVAVTLEHRLAEILALHIRQIEQQQACWVPSRTLQQQQDRETGNSSSSVSNQYFAMTLYDIMTLWRQSIATTSSLVESTAPAITTTAANVASFECVMRALDSLQQVVPWWIVILPGLNKERGEGEKMSPKRRNEWDESTLANRSRNTTVWIQGSTDESHDVSVVLRGKYQTKISSICTDDGRESKHIYEEGEGGDSKKHQHQQQQVTLTNTATRQLHLSLKRPHAALRESKDQLAVYEKDLRRAPSDSGSTTTDNTTTTTYASVVAMHPLSSGQTDPANGQDSTPASLIKLPQQQKSILFPEQDLGATANRSVHGNNQSLKPKGYEGHAEASSLPELPRKQERQQRPAKRRASFSHSSPTTTTTATTARTTLPPSNQVATQGTDRQEIRNQQLLPQTSDTMNSRVGWQQCRPSVVSPQRCDNRYSDSSSFGASQKTLRINPHLIFCNSDYNGGQVLLWENDSKCNIDTHRVLFPRELQHLMHALNSGQRI